MCRIFALCGGPGSASTLAALAKFGELAENGVVPKSSKPPGHKDGWGVVAYRDTDIALYEKNSASATDDPKFSAAINKTSELNPSVVVAHLRKASVGGLKPENTHPFVSGNWAFCHNGSINKGDLSSLRLNSEYSAQKEGETDSETFFLYFLQLLRDSNNPDESIILQKLTEEISSVRNTLDYTAMNLILTNGKTLLAVREDSEKK